LFVCLFAERGRQTVLGDCRSNIAPVVAMVTKDTSTWSIAKNAIIYLVSQSQHTVYCAVGPKSFSAVMARKTTSSTEWKTHQKQYISGASVGGVFFRLYKWFKNIYFKLVTSASHCQQLGLYSKCYTVCDFTLHWSHSKCPEVKTAKPLLSVLRTGKPNWRGVQLFRRTNRKMTNVLNNCNCSFFSLCNLCRSTSPVIWLPLEYNCNRTFFDLFRHFLS